MGHGESLPLVPMVLLYSLFFGSGMASLICETVWFKQLQFVLGSSTFAVSVVVASFFGGLAVGGWLGGRLADRSRHLLRLYAVLELSLGLASAALTLTLSCWETWIAACLLRGWDPSQACPDRSPFSSQPLLLIGPTASMGATLPVLGKHLARGTPARPSDRPALRSQHPRWCDRSALVGFFLIGRLGVIESGLVASAMYLAIAAGALVAVRLVPRDDPWEGSGPFGEPGQRVSSLRSDGWIALVVALTGFAAIAYEVLWFRLLTCFGVPDGLRLRRHAVDLPVWAWCSARSSPRSGWRPGADRHLADFARVQLMLVAAVVVSLAGLGRSRNLLAAIDELQRRLGIAEVLSGISAGTSTFLCLCLVILLLPSTLIGIGFPLAMELITGRHGTRIEPGPALQRQHARGRPRLAGGRFRPAALAGKSGIFHRHRTPEHGPRRDPGCVTAGAQGRPPAPTRKRAGRGLPHRRRRAPGEGLLEERPDLVPGCRGAGIPRKRRCDLRRPGVPVIGRRPLPATRGQRHVVREQLPARPAVHGHARPFANALAPGSAFGTGHLHRHGHDGRLADPARSARADLGR